MVTCVDYLTVQQPRDVVSNGYVKMVLDHIKERVTIKISMRGTSSRIVKNRCKDITNKAFVLP